MAAMQVSVDEVAVFVDGAMTAAMQVTDEVGMEVGSEGGEAVKTDEDCTTTQPEAAKPEEKNEDASGIDYEGLEAALKPLRQWVQQCSKHLSHIEKRLMEDEYLGHEVVRMVMQLLSGFSPAPYGDWGWLLRKCMDIAVKALRQLVRVYYKGVETMEAFMMRAMSLVRLYFEEAFHRTLLSAEGRLMRSGLCSLMVTLRNLEADTIVRDVDRLGCFWTFTEGNVRSLAMKVANNETTSLEMMPSYDEVMKSADMRVEAFSLKLVRVLPSSIVMSQAEVKALIESHGTVLDGTEELPGSEEPSAFFDLFPEDVEAPAEGSAM